MASISGSPSVSIIQHEREMASTSYPVQQPKQISRRNKTVAAISGAAVTSLLMTPFDVIKTRMQMQAPPDPLFQPSSRSTLGDSCCQSRTVINEKGLACRFDPRLEGDRKTIGPSSSSSRSYITSTKQHFDNNKSRSRIPQPSLHTSANHMSGAACIYPDKKSAVRDLKEIQNSHRLSGLWDGMIKVGRSEGMRGLWRGLTPTLIMTVPSQVTYMTCYDVFRTNILALRPPNTTSNSPSLSNLSGHQMIASLISGAMARSISATLVTPIELIRTRLQASTASSHGFTTLFGNLRSQVVREGPRVLFRGLGPTLYRDVPFSAIYFTGYESMKLILTGAGFGERRSDSVQHKDFAIAFISGSTSGLLAAIFTQPFDVIKTRLQASYHQSSSSKAPKTTIQAWKQIVKSEGAKGLMRGVSPRIAKVAPACGVMISCFELVARWLDDHF